MSLSVRGVLAGTILVPMGLFLAGCQSTPTDGGRLARADLEGGAPVADIRAHLVQGAYTARQLTQAALDRIRVRDGALHAVIAVNPDALAAADAVDAAAKAGRPLGPLAGIPILVKDNVETRDPVATTAGSLALAANVTGRDAPLVARLRAAGAIILGKANLSEWANIRSDQAASGWSAVGGLTASPVDPARSACGSSSGSAVGVAAGYAPLAVGTETDGSVTCPASMTGIVGLKPTLGLVSRTHVVPISHSQDTAGPMGRTVADVALMLGAMAGTDPADIATAEADTRRTDYAAGLAGASLQGVRIGVLRDFDGEPKTTALFNQALATLARAGAILVEVGKARVDGLGADEGLVLMTEFKADLNAYLATTPPMVRTRTLADLIAFNQANAAAEMPYFGQESFERAQATAGLTDPAYQAAAQRVHAIAAHRLDTLLQANQVAFLVSPTYGPAWLSDLIYGDRYEGPSAAQLPAVSGYPHLTVPMGGVQGMPVGLSFIGPRWSDAALLQAGHAFERARRQ
ncbi:amidase [Azospirillum sp. B4]|uniref:amidase n=1 Tax=Azospirillum sp. B4 TaxID=95605 RepID=UPI00034D9A7F|nr:amidase [Azospirillum sp. B4]